MRAQFLELLRHIPLLYAILSANVIAVAIAASHIDSFWLTRVIPVAFCAFCLTRAIWWWRRRFGHFNDATIRRLMVSTSLIASLLAAAVVGWVMVLFPFGNLSDHNHLVFFVAITLIACVFFLMPVRSAALSVASIGIVPSILAFLLADGGRMWVEASILAFVGLGMVHVLNRYNRSFAELIYSQRDLRNRQLETERLSEENRRIALTDALSGLPNRRALIARLEDIHRRSTQNAVSVAILFVDLDGFKQINDNFGHELGDTIIRRVSDEFARLLPEQAVLFRMGGDEFSILFEGPGAATLAMEVAGAILTWLGLPLRLAAHEFQLGASIGMASSEDDAVDPYELLRRADTAMYRAKAEGGNGAQAYTPDMDLGREWRQQVEAEMRGGIDRAEFTVLYQPLVEARTGKIIAVEALARWPGRRGEELGPGDFIPVAESSGLIHPLGLLVLRRACTELVGHGQLRLNVNVSPAQFRHPHFESEVAAVLHETGFPPERLQIEITEGYLIDHPARANRAIAAFTDMGVQVVLDDFGSGFASIGYLRQFPFSGIKIDKSLAVGLGRDPKALLLVTGMVHLANGLEMSVTAEGIETEQQAALFRLAGCHELQGYYFGMPASLAAIEHLPIRSAA
ncbi:putative bifunctional diguanylate cyclase/phosphodiesterase [Novosphingobium piscinae]|uniref:EAL domain-containing protein n=1 Tax=Novosphingobium piscinae TaxID=1507448 RepID=A0A7X1FWQ6_9SPHN|nr:EAL domain-containing protein [Novosphingobium piscinae]MBC2668423.1 EAL domain-containing protein [Novosphingobium piscinae]